MKLCGFQGSLKLLDSLRHTGNSQEAIEGYKQDTDVSMYSTHWPFKWSKAKCLGCTLDFTETLFCWIIEHYISVRMVVGSLAL